MGLIDRSVRVTSPQVSLSAVDQMCRVALKTLLLHMHWWNKKVFDHIESLSTGCFIFTHRNWNTVSLFTAWNAFKNCLKTTSLTEFSLQSQRCGPIYFSHWLALQFDLMCFELMGKQDIIFSGLSCCISSSGSQLNAAHHKTKLTKRHPKKGFFSV